MNNLKEIISFTNKLRILYVEDDVSVRETTYSILKDIFLEVIVADNGEEGLLQCDSRKLYPTLLLCDHRGLMRVWNPGLPPRYSLAYMLHVSAFLWRLADLPLVLIPFSPAGWAARPNRQLIKNS